MINCMQLSCCQKYELEEWIIIYLRFKFSAMIKATIYIFLQRAGGWCEPVKE